MTHEIQLVLFKYNSFFISLWFCLLQTHSHAFPTKQNKKKQQQQYVIQRENDDQSIFQFQTTISIENILDRGFAFYILELKNQ